MEPPDRYLWRVLILGCGNIAGRFDERRTFDAEPLTHAGAFSRVGGFELSACLDPDSERRSAFQRYWHVREALQDSAALVGRVGQFDVISICSPTAIHADHLELALRLRPRIVFCEKPVTPSAQETRAWAERFEAAGIPVAVNHTRRWASDIVRLRVQIHAGDWGPVRSAVGIYGKGLLNNGSHMVDLLQFLLGPLSVECAGQAVFDFWKSDPTIPAMLRTRDGVPIQLATSHARDYSLFELQLITEEGVIALEESGMRWRVRQPVDNAHFAGYRSLNNGAFTDGEYLLAMSRAVANIRDVLDKGAELASTIGSALQAQLVCEQICAASANAFRSIE